MAKEKKSKHLDSETKVDRDDLALLMQSAMNKSSKDGTKLSYFIDEEDNPSEVVEWVSTGSSLLDLAISNRPHGGLPVGRMVEFSGLEGTGKSLLCAHIMAETTKKQGFSVFFDSESAVSKQFWVALGVDIKNVNYTRFTTLEELFNLVETCIGAFRKADKDKLLTIIVDSIAASSVEAEMEAAHGVTGYNTSKSLILGKAMRKLTNLIANQRILIVFTNQVRYNMNAGPNGDKWITPGGKAVPFSCSVRVRTSTLGKLKKGDEVIGVKAQAKLIKNRCGPGNRTAEFEIHYDSGIQDLASWLKFAKEREIITGTGAKYTWARENGEKIEMNTSKFVELMNTDEKIKEEFYQLICKSYIMEYRDPNSKIVEDVKDDFSEDETQTVVED